MSPPRRVLVLRFGAAGDVVLTSPAIDVLRRAWPDTELCFVVKEELADLVRADPRLHQVVTLGRGESVFSLARRLRALRPDAVLDLHGKLRSRALRRLVPAARWVTWVKRDWRDTLPVRLALRPYRAEMLLAERFHRAVEELVGAPLPRGRLGFALAAADTDEAAALLSSRGIAPGTRLLGLSPGANWRTKRWPAARFAEVAARAAAAGLRVVITGSAAERHLAAPIVARVPEAIDLVGELPLRLLGPVIARCSVFVANDSGPMHLARGLGVPTVALFGSTDPAQFDFTGHRFAFAGEPCSPCHFYGRPFCPRGHFRCMTRLEPPGVWRSVEELLAQGPAAAVRG